MMILLCDPDPQARAQLRGWVVRLVPDAEVVEVEGAAQAEALVLGGKVPDLALVAYQLPDGYGPRVADTLTAGGVALAVVVSDVPALSRASAARVVRRADAPTCLPLWLDTAVRTRAVGRLAPPRPTLRARLARLVLGAEPAPAPARRLSGPIPRIR